MKTGNCKIKNSIITKLLTIQKFTKNGLTSTDIDILMFIARYQNTLGECKAFHSEVCRELRISKQSFYNSIYNLDKLGIITPIQSNTGWWSLRLNNNMFNSKSDYKSGYTNINKRMFSGPFSKLNVNEKLLCLLIMTNPRANLNKPICFSLNKLSELLKVKEYSIRKYLKSISNMFKIKIENNITYITSLEYYTDSTKVSERLQFLRHYYSCNLKSCNVPHAPRDIEDLCTLTIQYAERGFSRIVNSIQYVLDKFGILNSRYLNRMLQSFKPLKCQ